MCSEYCRLDRGVATFAAQQCSLNGRAHRGELSSGPFPRTFGHEGVGEIVAVGEGVTSRQVGDRVGIVPVQETCGWCGRCRRGEPLDFETVANCAAPVFTGMTVSGARAD